MNERRTLATPTSDEALSAARAAFSRGWLIALPILVFFAALACLSPFVESAFSD